MRLVMQRRHGFEKSARKLGPVKSSTLKPEWPMEVLQMDHTPVDVIVVDNERRLPIGRPWLTWRSMSEQGWWPAFTSLFGLRPRSPSPSPFRTQCWRRPHGWRIGNSESHWPVAGCPEQFTWTTRRNSTPRRSSAAVRSTAFNLTTDHEENPNMAVTSSG